MLLARIKLEQPGDVAGDWATGHMVSCYVKHPVAPGPQAMLMVQRSGLVLHMLDALTVLPKGVQAFTGPPTDNQILCIALALVEGVYQNDIRDYKFGKSGYKPSGDVWDPPYRSREAERLAVEVEKLLLSAQDRIPPKGPKLKIPAGARQTEARLKPLLERIRAASERMYGPGLPATVEMIVARLKRWTPYNLQEGRVAYSAKWEYKWRILSHWEKWESSKAAWIQRLEDAIPNFHDPKTDVAAEEERLRTTCRRLKLYRSDSHRANGN